MSVETKLKILIIGSGGREHAIGWKLKKEKRSIELYFAPGNAGTAQIGRNLPILASSIAELLKFAQEEKIGLILALPDDPLALGIVDEFQNAGLKIWGPSKAASELEWSKAYAKDFMKRNGVPTARYETFSNFEKAKVYIEKHSLPVVVKASGLALGKGVTVAQTKEEALKFLEDLMVNKIFGNAGHEVVIEEYLQGTEISVHALSDGKTWKLFRASQDHKRIEDGDVGPNTGGMGVVAPLPFVDNAMMARIEKEIVAKIIDGMAHEGRPFVGCLYPGVMLTLEGPKVFEINARFGDPEAQVYMRLMKNDLLPVIEASLDGKLEDVKIEWQDGAACNVVLASAGYPGVYEKGKVITGIEDAEKMEGVVVFHAGTKNDGVNLVTSGGRVLGVSVVAKDLERALSIAYEAIPRIKFEGMQYRKDIGKRALNI